MVTVGCKGLKEDIAQMFHQIRVRFNDNDALRFFWYEHMFNLIEEFKMNVHLFGKIDS